MPLFIVSDLTDSKLYWNADTKTFLSDYREATAFYCAVVTVCNLTPVKLYPNCKVVNSALEQQKYFDWKNNPHYYPKTKK